MVSLAPKRRLASWINAFLDFTEGKKSPTLFKKWAAISTIAGAMERRIWVRTATGELFPNLYVFLVGPPGGGKSVALNAARALLKDTEDIKLAPDNISAASLIDALNESKRRIVDLNAPYMEFNSLFVSASELSVLLPVFDLLLMANLTKFWDNEPFKEWKRGGNLRIDIAKPQVNILGGCTPEFLNNFLPAGAWGQGFMARVLMVYCGETPRKTLFTNGPSIVEEERPEFKVLLSDLKSMVARCGEMKPTAKAIELIQAWEDSGGKPLPEHSKLINYNTRRTTQLIKLSMISSMSRSDDLLIDVEDYQTALGWLMEIEAVMPDIFRAMNTGGTDSSSIEEAWRYIYQTHIQTGKTVSEFQLVHFLQNRVPAHSVMRIVELLIKSNMIVRVHNDLGQTHYKPTPKHLHANV